jgi:hypothetical protein
MILTPRLLAATRRILDGDVYVDTANALEAEILAANGADDPENDPWDGLISALAMYEPFQGRPYVSPSEMCAEIRRSPIFDPREPGHLT